MPLKPLPQKRLPTPIEIAILKIADLKPDPRNARIHPVEQIDQIAGSIDQFGFNVPILIDNKRSVIAGHGRILAAKKLGQTEVPTICLKHLSESQRIAFMIAENRLTENATWDNRLLGELYKELADSDLDFSLDITGFDLPRIDFLIQDLATTSKEPDVADRLPSDAPAVSVVGDLWKAGRHRALCGDARSEPDYCRLMRGQVADIAITDPPWNLPIEGHVSGLGTVKHKNFVMASGEMSHEAYTAFLGAFINLLCKYSRSGSIHYIFIDWRHIQELVSIGLSAYSELKNICIWTKDNGGMGSLYRSQHEMIAVFKNGRAPHVNNIELGRHGRCRTNIWHYPGMNSFSRNKDEKDLLAKHPTSKPVRLLSDAMMDCSNRGDLVLDPFLGSGSGLIAAERTGRIAYGMELDPKYVDTTIRRYQLLTGREVIHEESGRTFNEIAKSRESARA